MPLSENRSLYWKELYVTDPECDVHNRMKLSFILRHLQEICGEHLAVLGYSNETLFRSGQAFFLSRLRLDLLRRPKSGELLRWQTKPLPPVGVQFVRSSDAYDMDGNLLLHSDSLWTLVNPDTRKILRPNAFGGTLPYDGIFGREQANRLRIHAPEQLEPACEREIRYSDLDINRHANNAAYADYVMDALPDSLCLMHEPRQLLLTYHNEARLHDKLLFLRGKNDQGGWYVRAQAERICLEAEVFFDEETEEAPFTQA